MGRTRVDESRWPLVVFTAVGEQSEEDFEAYLEDSTRLLLRRELFGSVFDASRAAVIGPKLRLRQAQWLERREALLRAYLVGTGMVLPSPLLRWTFRAILWRKPLPYPYSVEDTLEAAKLFVYQRFLECGMPTPAWFSGHAAGPSSRWAVHPLALRSLLGRNLAPRDPGAKSTPSGRERSP